VTFNVVVKSLRTTEKALKSAGWMLLDAAENLFLTAKARVYGKSLDEDGKYSFFFNSTLQLINHCLKFIFLQPSLNWKKTPNGKL
jgi:hypothetical protein